MSDEEDGNDLATLFGSSRAPGISQRYGQLGLVTSTREGQAITLLADLVFNSAFALAEAIEFGDVSCPGGSVIEFGSASGLPSLLLATRTNAPRLVTLTDHPSVVATAQKNASSASSLARAQRCDVVVLPHSWGEDVIPLLAANDGKRYDLALLSDLLYLSDAAEALVHSLAGTLAPMGRAMIYAGRYTPERVIARFEELLAREGLSWRELELSEGWHGTTDIDGVVRTESGPAKTEYEVRTGMSERKAQVRAWEAKWTAAR